MVQHGDSSRRIPRQPATITQLTVRCVVIVRGVMLTTYLVNETQVGMSYIVPIGRYMAVSTLPSISASLD